MTRRGFISFLGGAVASLVAIPTICAKATKAAPKRFTFRRYYVPPEKPLRFSDLIANSNTYTGINREAEINIYWMPPDKKLKGEMNQFFQPGVSA